MLNVLYTKDWRKSKPLAFYMDPLRKQLDEVIKILIKMRHDGVLRCKYYLEENRLMQKNVIELIRRDVDVQWLAGDQLKRDQFEFIC